MERAFTTVVACALLASFLFAGAACAQEFPKVTVGTTTKADVLDAAGPPAQMRAIEGDDFWYYIVSQRSDLINLGIRQQLRDLQSTPVVPQNPMAQLGTVLQGIGSGMQGKPNPALDFWQEQRQQDLRNLQEQARVGETLGRLPDRVLILRFDGTTGILKSVHQR